jgi:hypothetical protein
MPIHGLHKPDILAYAPPISNKRSAELNLFCRMSPDCTHANTANIMMRLRDRKSPHEYQQYGLGESPIDAREVKARRTKREKAVGVTFAARSSNQF